jgi:hypothetical protein
MPNKRRQSAHSPIVEVSGARITRGLNAFGKLSLAQQLPMYWTRLTMAFNQHRLKGLSNQRGERFAVLKF